jgi:hypothetical protein
MWCKKCKKVKNFLFDFFGKNEMGIGNFRLGCQITSIYTWLYWRKGMSKISKRKEKKILKLCEF